MYTVMLPVLRNVKAMRQRPDCRHRYHWFHYRSHSEASDAAATGATIRDGQVVMLTAFGNARLCHLPSDSLNDQLPVQ
jgi:hypothetical protein